MKRSSTHTAKVSRKSWLAVLATLMLAFSITACSSSSEREDDNEGPNPANFSQQTRWSNRLVPFVIYQDSVYSYKYNFVRHWGPDKTGEIDTVVPMKIEGATLKFSMRNPANKRIEEFNLEYSMKVWDNIPYIELKTGNDLTALVPQDPRAVNIEGAPVKTFPPFELKGQTIGAVLDTNLVVKDTTLNGHNYLRLWRLKEDPRMAIMTITGNYIYRIEYRDLETEEAAAIQADVTRQSGVEPAHRAAEPDPVQYSCENYIWSNNGLKLNLDRCIFNEDFKKDNAMAFAQMKGNFPEKWKLSYSNTLKEALFGALYAQ